MNGQVCKHRVLDIWTTLRHGSCLFLLSHTLLYMSGHHSVDIAVWISQGSETTVQTLSNAGAGVGDYQTRVII